MILTDNPLAAQLRPLFARLDPAAGAELATLVEQLAAANQAGHVCLPLGARAARLPASPLLGHPGDYAPLILDRAGRLYFARHWHDEKRLADRLSSMAGERSEVDADRVSKVLARLFPAADPARPDRQKLAAALALRQRLLVISGGPGTGKTTTVVRLLAALAELSPRPLAMAMAAPTGKAAARLTESVQGASEQLALDAAVRRQLPAGAQTLHRLLGLRPGLTTQRHHAGHPLPLDVLVVDEASMIDLALMAKTLDALPPHARLILLGDRDQLASVDPGAVLGELCQTVSYRLETLAWLAQVCGALPEGLATAPHALADSVVLLTHSHRFAADSGIGALARAVNAGDAPQALAVLDDDAYPDVGWQPGDLAEGLWQARQDYFAAVAAGAEPDALQREFGRFMVLAAERRQVEACNRAIEARLEAAGRKSPERDNYPGRPLMITENDYGIGLFNGDIGFAVQRADGLRVAFPTADGGWRDIAPGRLPAHQTVFAMTVHKSQGSEFERVWLALPEAASASLNRALVYTAITRARRAFAVLGSAEIWTTALEQAPERASGLAERFVGG
ncbi:exodeoxyribonuclease V subunit alpha [Pseudogulbenkiania sp. MAI-1]|uniref:exodeoxyribonuclease V subunit alpha n=1 Tax=Pseudogulbenkiania sp. MAI-1 TaxID=990370 RepID=UPI00045EBE90|nr:exodeoxyribonuclease V subunit alpha [Pseudogulbenkiania sp. MAI-1]